MALDGISPLIIFTFYREQKIPASFVGPIKPLRIPLVPIPLYLDERITSVQLDDYDRDISIDVLRDGVSAFERVSGDVINLKFQMNKNNIVLSVLTALIDRIIETFNKKVSPDLDITNYSLTIFYDNIFALDASLERFHTSLIPGTDYREVSFTFSRRSAKDTLAKNTIANTAGSASGPFLGG